MKLLILLGLFVFSAEAREFKLIELRDVKATYIDFFPNGREPIITNNGLPNRMLGKEVDLQVNTDILKYGFWNNIIHSMTDQMKDSNSGQFRYVGLETQLGIRVAPFLDVYFHHFSKHVMDTPSTLGAFPVQDGIGIHLYLYRRDTPQSDSVLGKEVR